MSWYYSYRLMYKNKEDGKFYPFGPFDYKGDYKTVLCKSHSFASNLFEEFRDIGDAANRKALISEELYEAINGELGEEDKKEFYEGSGYYHWSYLPIQDLPKGDYIRREYVLIDQIEAYESEDSYFDDFYETISPAIYLRKVENELKFGPPKPEKDCEGYEHTPHSMSEYSYYMWIDHQSKEYEAHVIREALGFMRDWYDFEHNEEEIYVLLTQG